MVGVKGVAVSKTLCFDISAIHDGQPPVKETKTAAMRKKWLRYENTARKTKEKIDVQEQKNKNKNVFRRTNRE